MAAEAEFIWVLVRARRLSAPQVRYNRGNIALPSIGHFRWRHLRGKPRRRHHCVAINDNCLNAPNQLCLGVIRFLTPYSTALWGCILLYTTLTVS